MEIKIGTKVKMVGCLEGEKYKDKVWTVHSNPYNVSGTPCVLLEGKSGGFAVENLEVVEGDNV